MLVITDHRPLLEEGKHSDLNALGLKALGWSVEHICIKAEDC